MNAVERLEHDQDIVHGDSEIQLLQFASDALERHKGRPDCFGRVGQRVRSQCASLDHHQDERVAGAISMTLCEIRTAQHYSIPMECASFDVDSVEGRITEGDSSSGPCVDALSRSTQLWSSYSGYLREIPLLCVAFRRLNDIDLAREIYRNVTLEKIDFIRFLQGRRKLDTERQLRWFAQQQGLEDLVRDLDASTSSLKAAIHTDLVDGVRAMLDEMTQSYSSNTVSQLSDLRIHQAELLRKSASSLDSIIFNLATDASTVMHKLEVAIERQFDSLAVHHSAFEERFSVTLNHALSISSAMEQTMNQFTSTMALVGNQVAVVANQTRNIALDLWHIENGHAGLATVTTDLSFSLRALVNHVQSELQTINTTMADIRQGVSGRNILWSVSALALSPWISYLPWVVLCLPGSFRVFLAVAVYSLKLFLSFPVAYLLGWLFTRTKIGPSEGARVHERLIDVPSCREIGRRRPTVVLKDRSSSRLDPLYSIAQLDGTRSTRIPARLLL